MISPWSRDETPSGISAPLLDETSRGLGASITISENGITGVRIVPVYLGSSGRPKMLEPGAPHHAEILRIVAEHRSEEHTSELQSLMRISYAVFCLKKNKNTNITHHSICILSYTNIETR